MGLKYLENVTNGAIDISRILEWYFADMLVLQFAWTRDRLVVTRIDEY